MDARSGLISILQVTCQEQDPGLTPTERPPTCCYMMMVVRSRKIGLPGPLKACGSGRKLNEMNGLPQTPGLAPGPGHTLALPWHTV